MNSAIAISCGFLLNILIGEVVGYDFDRCMLLSIWVSLLAVWKFNENYSLQVIILFQVSCTQFLYWLFPCLSTLLLFINLRFSWIDMNFAAHRLRMIILCTANRITFNEAVFIDAAAFVGSWYFESYTYLMLDILITCSIVYVKIFFVLIKH